MKKHLLSFILLIAGFGMANAAEPVKGIVCTAAGEEVAFIPLTDAPQVKYETKEGVQHAVVLVGGVEKLSIALVDGGTLTVSYDSRALHEHNYAEAWSSDETNHWHACTGDGECDAPKADEAAHAYGEVAIETAYYTCSVCLYENAERKVEYLQALAQPVIDLIDAIGDINEFSNKNIVAARDAYDALPEEAQAYVTNYDVLLAAEAKYKEINEFYVYRNSRAIYLGLLVGPFDKAGVGDLAAEAVKKLTVLRYEPDLTLDQNKQNVDEIFQAYYQTILEKRQGTAATIIFADAKDAAKASIMFFLGISGSPTAREAAETGVAAIDALEYNSEVDVINNIEEIRNIVIDTKINIVKAWIADFEDFKDNIRNIIGIDPQLESVAYDKEITYNENIAKLEAIRQAVGGSATSIESIGADSAKPMKYIENGKLVIVKDCKKYGAQGAQMK